MTKIVTHQDLSQAIQEMGLAGRVVAMHSSLRSFGTLEGGADALIQAFLEQRCTLVVPTFTYTCEAGIRRHIPQNGLDDEHAHYSPAQVDPFFQQGDLISPEMGVTPARILETPGRIRGRHPLNSISAIGPRAREAIAGQDFMNVYAPYRWMDTIPGSVLLLVGVNLTSATPIHYAEERAGRQLFRRWGSWEGQIVETQVGSCSEAFENLSPIVAEIEQCIHVGTSLWRIFPFKPFIDRAAQAIRDNPAITVCEENCARCRDAVLGGPILG